MEKFELQSDYDDLCISVSVNKPKKKPWAIVQFVHGMCGSKERFEQVMNFLADNGIICVASDLRGHGESIKDQNDLGYFYKSGYKALVSDVRKVTYFALNKFPKLPFYLLGHSMGSLVARIYAKEDDSKLSGLIICGSPSYNPWSLVGRFLTGIPCLMGLGRLRSKYLQMITSRSYNKRFIHEGELAWTCSDANMRKSFRNNPMYNFNFTFNGANNLLKMMNKTYSLKGWKVSNKMLPIIFISGLDDPCIISQKKFHQAIKKLKKIGYINVFPLLYPKMRHEVLNEINKENVWFEILKFIKSSQQMSYDY